MMEFNNTVDEIKSSNYSLEFKQARKDWLFEKGKVKCSYYFCSKKLIIFTGVIKIVQIALFRLIVKGKLNLK